MAIVSDKYGNEYNPQGVSSDYPIGAVPITGSSGTVANGSTVATLAAAVGKTTYVTGFIISGTGATIGLAVAPTLVGVISGTMTFAYAAIAGALLMSTPMVVTFPKPIPASAVNMAITLTVPALGLGNTNSTAVIFGYQL